MVDTIASLELTCAAEQKKFAMRINKTKEKYDIHTIGDALDVINSKMEETEDVSTIDDTFTE